MALEAGSVYAVLGGRFNPAGFAQFDGAMKRSVSKTKTAEGAMASSFARTGAASQAMANTVASSAAKLQAAQVAQQRAALRVEAATVAATAATKRHGGESMAARQKTLALTQAQQQLATANNNLATASAAHAAAQSQLTAKQSAGSKAAQALGLTSRNLATGGIAAVGLAMYGSLKASANFQKEIADLGAVTGASGAQLKQMGDAAMTVGAKTGTGASQAAQAMTELAKGGLDAKTATSALTGTVAMAQAGSLDLATAGETVANALNLFGMEGSQATLVADAFANAANSTTADIGFFSQGMAQGGAAAKAAGLDFQEATVFLEAMAANGFKSGSDAGTSMKTALIQLANPTKRAADEAAKLGVTFFKANGDMKSLPTISKQLGDAFDGLSRKEKLASAVRLAGTDGMRALLALVDQGPQKLKRFEEANAKTGTAAEVARKKMNSLSGQSQRLGAELETLGIKIGGKLEPALRDAASATADFFAQMREGRGVGGTVGTILTQLGRVQQTIWAMATGNMDWMNMAEIWGAGFSRAAVKILGVIRTIAVAMKVVGLASQADIDRIDRTTAKLRTLEVKQRVTADVKNATEVLSKLNRYKLAPKVQKILTSGDTSAKDKINQLVKLGIPRKVAKVMVSGDTTVKQKIAMLEALNISRKEAKIIAKDMTLQGIIQARSSLDSLQPAYIPIFGQYKGLSNKPPGNARGRASGKAELSMVGEGGGPEYIVNSETGQSMKVSAPTLMALDEADYVIPTESKYQGRALGLMQMLMKDMGIVGYAGGRPARKKGESKKAYERRLAKWREGAKRREILGNQGAAFSQHSLEWYDTEISKEEGFADNKHTKGKMKGKLTARAKAARAKLKELRRERSRAKGYQGKIDSATSEADVQLDLMTNADREGNQGAFNAAYGIRRQKISEAIGLIEKVLPYAPKGSSWERTLRGQLAKLKGDFIDLKAETPGDITGEGTGFAEAPDETTYTAAELGRITDLDAAIAQAGLTEGINDDRQAMEAKASFLQGIYDAVAPTGGRGRGGSAAIRDIATDLRAARDQITGLTTQGPTADQQQVIDQQIANARLAGQTTFIDRLAEATMGGANQTLVFQSYVPPSPTEAKRLADYTVGGIGYQRGRPGSTERLGV